MMKRMFDKNCKPSDKSRTLPSNVKPNSSNTVMPRHIYPRHSQILIFLVALVIRIYYVSKPNNWWILHPDEIYQSLEVAHSEVYGYGFRPYEYLSSIPNDNDTKLRQRELQLGMAAMRSFIYPGYFIVISHLVGMCGINLQPFMAWKIAHALITSCLPLTIFLFSKRLYRSHDVGVMASLFVASSVHLNVFGTHTLINSFLAPLVFLSLYVMLYIFRVNNNRHVDPTTNSSDSNPSISNPLSVLNILREMYRPDYLFKSYEIVPSGIHGLKKRSDVFAPPVDQMDYPNKLKSMLLLWRYLRHHLSVLVASCLLTTCCYMRPDLTVFSIVVLLPYLQLCNVLSAVSVSVLCGCLTSVSLCVLCDFVTYGYGVISPWNWFNFNILHHYSGALFGTMSFSFYCNVLFFECYVNCALVLLSAPLLLYVVMRFTRTENIHTIANLVFSFSVLLFLHSLQGHKESRHIHNLFCLFYIIVSGIFTSWLKLFCATNSSRIIVMSISMLCVLNVYKQFPSPKDKSNISWVYGQIYDTTDINACLNFVGSTNDVTGVFLDRSVHMSGAYSLLHKDVPLLVLMINEFNEFDYNSRVNLTTNTCSDYKSTSVTTCSRVSNFISVYNAPYVLKILINNRKYNYLIIRRNRPFIKYGYKEVFTSGNMQVLRRTFKMDDERRLLETENRISLGSNATVLNYEGNWLSDMGATELAVQRLEASNSLDPKIINNYQLLSNIYFTRGDKQKASNIIKKCYDLYNKQICMKLDPHKILHSEYAISL